jgi:MFS transporter, DHA2 family, multidrug resistance protein
MTTESGELALGNARRWAITVSVMLVSVLQILDTSITNVALPHIQGALSAGLDEVSWVLTSFLAANAIVLPATGWLTSRLGRRRFFLLCTIVFSLGSLLSAVAPSVDVLIAARVLQGLGGGPIIPIAQAVLWEIFPPRQRGMAMAVWGMGIVLAPTFGPTVGGWIADNWSWRWIFYINLPFGAVGFLMASMLLFDSPHAKPAGRVDLLGLCLMILGFGGLQLVLDRGERDDWFDSPMITALAVLAVAGLAAFVIRELTADEPLLDLGVLADRNFTVGSIVMSMAGFGFYASMLLLALYTQQLMGYDAWTSGLVLAPSGLGQAAMLLVVGSLVNRVDQRLILSFGVLMNGLATFLMSNVTLTIDFWSLALPRLIQGVGMGCIFVPLQMLAFASIPIRQLPNATALFSVVRNIGGSAGVAISTTLLTRRAQMHQSALVANVHVWGLETTERLRLWTQHFQSHGADAVTAAQQGVAMLYRETVTQAQVLAFMDDFRLLAVMYAGLVVLILLMRRVRTAPAERAGGDDERAVAAAAAE